MAQTIYRELAEFGLPLIGADDPLFAPLVGEMLEVEEPGPFGLPEEISGRAAILLNQSGRSIVGLEFVWRFTATDGKTRTSRCSTFSSSAQREVLAGRTKVGRDRGTFVLPESKRLITEDGIFGSNVDVLTAEEADTLRGWCGGFAGGGRIRVRDDEEVAAAELVLDFVVLDDGLCVGPDETGIFRELNEALEVQQRVAAEALKILRSGGSEGRIFELLKPLASHRRRGSPFLSSFSHEGISVLTNLTSEQMLAWFEREASPRTLQLRRP